MPRIIGIDLGTTYSAMAVINKGQPEIIENSEGARTTPSVTALSKSGEILVGVTAKRQQVVNSQNTLYGIKRLIGRRFSDPEVQKDKTLYPYEMKEAEDGGVLVKMGDPSTSSGQGRWYKPAEISAKVLQKLKRDAESRLGQKIEEAVITCPAYFDDSQRKATKVAGEIAGFKVKRVLNEPTAAALAYGLDKKGERRVLVYDFGGGTFDISILEVSENTIEVKATGGDTHLGGEDIDHKITEWIVKEFKKDQGIDLSKDPLALQRLREAAEKSKIELSTALETEINLPFITSGQDGPKHLLYRLSRAKLEELSAELIDRSIELVKLTLKEAKLQPQDIQDILLVGGQTRMPKIQHDVQKLFGREPKRDINPDEVVALGAAVQAGILQGEVKDILLLDVTPLSLGIETLGGVNTAIIPKNTTVPATKSQIFSTAADNQTSVEIHVVQGERPMAKDNKSLGRFILDGIPPSPRGVPQIEVAFDIDANGILSVTAKDKTTNKSQSIKIEGSTGISQEEIEKLRREAELHAEQDRKIKKLVEARNLAESLIYTAEKSLRESGNKIPVQTRKEVEDKMEDLKRTKDSQDIEAIKNKTSELSQVLQKIGQQMHNSKEEKTDGGQGNSSKQ